MRKMENSELARKKIEHTDVSNFVSSQVNYRKRTEECLSDLENLW